MILSGKAASDFFYTSLLERTKKLSKIPKLVAVQVGDNPASSTYLRIKEKKLLKLNFQFELKKFEENISEEKLIEEIEKLNQNEDCTGIIVQLPLPKNLNEKKILDSVSIKKDVDCLNSANLGTFFQGNSEILPATAKGVIRLLEFNKTDLDGKKICVIGRSNLVTKPLAIELVNRNATVTICHSKTKNLIEETRQADIVITGIGKANFLTKEYFKPGQIIIDIGTSINDEGKLAGDVSFNEVEEIVEAITPVPGGVGPMTVYGLIENLVILTEKNF